MAFIILTDNIQIAHLAFHGIRINLTHVPAFIAFLDILNTHRPCLVLRVSDANALIFSNYMILYGQNGLSVNA